MVPGDILSLKDGLTKIKQEISSLTKQDPLAYKILASKERKN